MNDLKVFIIPAESRNITFCVSPREDDTFFFRGILTVEEASELITSLTEQVRRTKEYINFVNSEAFIEQYTYVATEKTKQAEDILDISNEI